MGANVPQVQAAEPWMRRFLMPRWDARKRLLLLEARLGIATSYPALAFAYLWPEDLRNTNPGFVLAAWAAFMIRTFLFHAGVLYLLIALGAAWKKHLRLFAGAVPLVVFTLGPTVAEYLPRNPPPIAGEAITVMSANLLMANRNMAPLIAEIQAAAPDVLLLQEYADQWHDALQVNIGAEYPHIAHVRREDSFGIAVYSRRPFLEPVQLDLPLGTTDAPQIRAVIEISGRPVAFYNVHPLPPRSLRYVTESRLQAADLIEMLRAEPLPAVVSGDFNFTERTPQFGMLTDIGLTETHALAGRGRGATWPVLSIFRWLPGLRLDRIFLSAGLTASHSRTGAGRGSDHRPVIARVGLHER
jgi:endonuclease/exonuclease/phosphatase (EEP) superfamily protein YafD